MQESNNLPRFHISQDKRLPNIFRFYRNMFKYQKKYPIKLTVLLITIFIHISYETVVPQFYRMIFDKALANKDIALFIKLMGLVCGSALIYFMSNITQSVILSSLFSKIGRYLRLNLFNRIKTFNKNGGISASKGDVIESFSSNINFIEYVGMNVMWTVVRSFITAFISFLILIYVNWMLTLSVVILLPIFLYLPKRIARSVAKHQRAKNLSESTMLDMVDEEFSLQNIIKYFRLENYQRKKFKKILKAASKNLFLFYLKLDLTARASSIGTSLTTLAVIGGGAYLVLIGHLSIGQFIIFILLLGNISTAIAIVTNQYSSLYQAAAKLNRIHWLLFKKPGNQIHYGMNELSNFQYNIKFENVCVVLNDKHVLTNLNLIISKNQSFAIVGPSGAGKSTLLKVLLREIPISSGRVTIDGMDLNSFSSNSLFSHIGIVSQDIKLFNTSIKENIRMGKLGATDEDIVAAAKQAKIHEEILQLPEGYDTVMARHHTNLSGGQEQRISIARALIRKPDLLYLDEINSSLDPLAEAAINETIKQIKGTCTIVSVTHRLASVADTDCVFVLDKGCLVESGTHDELLKKKGLYAQLWEHNQLN